MAKSERGLAVDVLMDVLEGGAYANVALRRVLGEAEMDARGRAFVTDMVNETLRNLILVDFLIGRHSKTPMEKMRPFIRGLLRVSICQIVCMKVPSHAAVNEAVELTRKHGLVNLTGFVNGVLRAVTRLKPDFLDKLKDPALRYSYPGWLYKALVGWLGAEGAAEFCRNSHNPPPVMARINTVKINQEALVETLVAEGVLAQPHGDFVMLRQAGDISKLASFNDGLFFVMDPGAMLAVEVLQPLPGQVIFDVCAAPGGKSFAMASLMENNGEIRAFDIHKHKVELIRQTAKRLGITIIAPDLKDACEFDPTLAGKADAVLVDAPCSGLGTIRKHPEIKYSRGMKEIKELAKLQLQILQNAAKYVKPGGALVYCTCTVANEENIDNINAFLTGNPGFKLESTRQIMPGAASDGFFVAKLISNV
ncbi:MAG: 16S rRNA (cytosine(967)-C(5))-methyltransferase RsmB [Defluviitaleaceae bacterium]|nr:16S rRNA (cytosine(967)-C(5))-methyltransferase RsmB [Defluviitaleaceae bacterium]